MTDIEKLIHDWRANVGEYAKAKADHDYLYEFRKSLKAILMTEALKEGIDKANAQERYAYAHKRYTELLDGLRVATEKAEDLRYRMKIAEARVEVWRTKQANSRREKSMYNA